MTAAPPERDPAELLDGLVQLRFSAEAGSLHDLNAAEVAEVLQGLVEFTSQMAKAGLFGEGPPPQVRVRPPREGSFVVEALVQWAQANPEGAVGSLLTAGGVLGQGVVVAVQRLRGAQPENVEHLDNGNVMLTWRGGGVNEVPSGAWRELNNQKRQTRRALRKIMAPLSDDVTALEVRGAGAEEDTTAVQQAEPVVVLDRSDYRTAVAEPPEEEDSEDTFEVEAELRSIDFRPGEKWRIRTRRGTRRATMEDRDFLRRVDEGLALRKSDIFQLRIQETVSVNKGRRSTSWTILEVVRHRRGGTDDDREAPQPTPSA